ncbi:hypothetical protein NE237_015087 [Protea cynaroides]|uniref:Uncharacterized protein n=1 Tax=Protea cynaroides TaxID=273540 RepID=A0A9Q0KDK8_9MAGN|nr:hypothetical protein NE237_015087 [Protea cynaroides]
MDVVYDVYTTVLKDVLDGKTIIFSMKVFLPDGIQELELELRTDNDVLTMFNTYEYEDQPMQCFSFGADVSELSSIDYTVNGYPNLIMGRPNQTMVVKSPLKENLVKKTLCKKPTPTANKFAIIVVTNNNQKIRNSSMTIQGSVRDFVSSSRKDISNASTSKTKDKSANKYHVNLSSKEDCIGDDVSTNKEWAKASN